MFRIIWKTIFLRFCEISLVTMVLSIVATFISLNLAKNDATIYIILLIGVIFFSLLQFFMLRKCRYDILSSRYYFIINMIAFGLSVGVHTLLYNKLSNEIYTWLFSLTKFAIYSGKNISFLASNCVFYGIILALTLVLSVDYYRLFRYLQHRFKKD